MLRALLISSLVVGLLAAAAAASPPAPITMCIIWNGAHTEQAQHAKFAASFYASEYPQLSVTAKYIGAWDPSGISTQRGVVQAFAANGSDCTLLIGPGASALSTAINPLVNIPWVEYGATATELSSRTNYPYFTRVIPNTGIATRITASVLQQLGWSTINMMFSSSSHGLSAASTMSSSMAANGKILRSDVIADDASVDDMKALFSIYLQSSTKLLFVAIASTDAVLATFMTAATAMNATDHMVIFFSEGMCSGNAWATLSGSFCIATQVDTANALPFVRAYRTTRNLTAETAAFTALGFPASQVDTTSIGSYPSLAADAARFALRALGTYVSQNGALVGGTKSIVNAIGNHVMSNGLTGYVAIVNTTGDRVGASFVIMNAQPDSLTMPAFQVSAQNNVTIASDVYLLGQFYATNSLPVLIDSGAPAVVSVFIGVGAACATVIIIALAMLTLIPRWKQWRRLQVAPREEATPFTIVFTDIERSTALWAELPELMGAVLDKHNAIIRAALEAHEGYEVKTIGDSFMCAFASAANALRFAVAVQQGLHKGDFIPEVDDFYHRMMRELGLVSPADYDALWHGVRVRIGVHTGNGTIVFDTVHKIYDYYGSVVNTAARIENMGYGGQILASEATLQAAGYRSAVSADRVELPLVHSGVIAMAVGRVSLRGVPEPVPLFDVRPAQFALRTFPTSIRAAVEAQKSDDGGDDVDDESHSSDMEGEALIRDVLKQLDTTLASSTVKSSAALQRRRSSAVKGLGVLAEAAAVEARAGVRRVLAVKFKRGCTKGSSEAKYRAAVAMELFLGLNAMLRAFPADRRARVLTDASAAWRIPRVGTSPSEADHDLELMMQLAVKIVQVLGSARVLSTDNPRGSLTTTDHLMDSAELTSVVDAGSPFPGEASVMKETPLP